MYANQQPASYTTRHYVYDPQINSANLRRSSNFLDNYQTNNERGNLEQRQSAFE